VLDHSRRFIRDDAPTVFVMRQERNFGLRVRAGQTVTICNDDDPDFHTFTADNGAWDSGRMDSGSSFRFTYRYGNSQRNNLVGPGLVSRSISAPSSSTCRTIPSSASPTRRSAAPTTCVSPTPFWIPGKSTWGSG